MQKTNINYLDYTWNPIAMRCTPVSEGCANCWHLAVCDRHAKNPRLPGVVRRAKQGGSPVLREQELDAPLRKRKPSTIGVQFMGDWMHDAVPKTWIADMLDVMGCRDHMFLTLTKRPQNLALKLGEKYMSCWDYRKNIWLGVTCENQKWADIRIRQLEQIPAAVRFVSFEPLLEEMVVQTRGIDWAIIGCESGPKRRPCELGWIYSLVYQFKSEGKAVWVKQIPINGKVSHDMNEWPEELRIREWPNKSEASDE